MSKKSKMLILEIPNGDERLTITKKYGVCRLCSNSDAIVEHGSVSHAELDQIVRYATAKRNDTVPVLIEETSSGHAVQYHDNGDVEVGCQSIPYSLLVKGHKLSLAIRSRSRK